MGLDRLSTLEKDIETKVAAAKNELIILEGIKDTDIWADRLALSLNARQSADNKMWTGPTSGVIAARLQQTLRNISKAHNIQNIRLRIDPEPTNVDTVQVLAFDLQGAAPETRTTVDILSGFASHPQIILIKEATITNTVRNPAQLRRTRTTLSRQVFNETTLYIYRNRAFCTERHSWLVASERKDG